MRKISAHYLFTGKGPPLKFGILVTDNHGRVLEVIDTKGKIREVAGLEFYPGILVPGFVNAHLHLELSHLSATVPPDTQLSGFIGYVVDHRNDHPDIIQKAALRADLMMLKEGIVAAGDICNDTATIPVKQSSRIRYHNFIEFFGLDPDQASTVAHNARVVKDQFLKEGLTASLSPHAAYSVSEKLWETMAGELNRQPFFSIHHDESEEERMLLRMLKGALAERFIRKGYQLEALPREASSIEKLLGRFAPKPRKLLVHNTLSEKTDPFVKELSNCTLVICPGSNLHISNRLPDLHGLIQSGLPICIGTDSLASNRQLSILQELILINRHFPEIPFEETLKWATLNGATALGMDKDFGSFEKGKKPGVVQIQIFDFDKMQVTEKSQALRLF